jgi:hypothetical protein
MLREDVVQTWCAPLDVRGEGLGRSPPRSSDRPRRPSHLAPHNTCITTRGHWKVLSGTPGHSIFAAQACDQGFRFALTRRRTVVRNHQRPQRGHSRGRLVPTHLGSHTHHARGESGEVTLAHARVSSPSQRLRRGLRRVGERAACQPSRRYTMSRDVRASRTHRTANEGQALGRRRGGLAGFRTGR